MKANAAQRCNTVSHKATEKDEPKQKQKSGQSNQDQNLNMPTSHLQLHQKVNMIFWPCLLCVVVPIFYLPIEPVNHQGYIFFSLI